PVKALVFHTVGGVTQLYAFTGGRGAWRTTTSNSACAFSLSSTNRAVAGDGGAFDVNVKVDPENGSCARKARSNADWITITGGADGSGAGVVTYMVAPNNSAEARTGTLTIAGRSFVVMQSPAVDTTPPTIAITSPTSSGIYRTDLETLSLAGTASDNIGVTQITLTSD